MKNNIMLGLLLAAATAGADTATRFFADFEGAAKDTRITAANRLTTIEPGTAIGSWEIIKDRAGTRVMDTAAGAALQMRTGFYNFKGHLDGVIDLAETPATIGFDFRVGADSGATDWTLFRIQNTNGQNIAAFRLRNGPIQVYDYSTGAWTAISDETFTPLAFSDDLADGLMDALEIRIESTQTVYYANGNQVYAHASSVNAHSAATFDIYAVTNTGTGAASTWYDNISVVAGFEVGTPFDQWIAGYGLSGSPDADPGYDYDGDGRLNLYEYALGGNPTNPADTGVMPTFAVAGGVLEYVHLVRTDDPGLDYHLELKPDLVASSWTNIGYTVSGTNVLDESFAEITNTVPLDVDAKFLQLVIGLQ